MIAIVGVDLDGNPVTLDHGLNTLPEINTTMSTWTAPRGHSCPALSRGLRSVTAVQPVSGLVEGPSRNRGDAQTLKRVMWA
ncbi:hypothetical protein [Promicromonospora sp. NPDC050880]|uniref:hypothetical protein n=1 Tax=Promicromonospora sp. NPDC050880 TaxID=3364406 RepID=UPI0037B9AD92